MTYPLTTYCLLIGGFSVVAAVLLTAMSYKIVQILQLSSYRVKGLFSWFKTSKGDYLLRYFSVGFFAFVCMLVFVACFGKYKYIEFIGLIFFLFHTVLFLAITRRQKEKTPLKLTPRVLRMFIITAVLFVLASFGLLFAGAYMPVRYSLLGLLPMFVPWITLAAYYILLPFEMLNNYGYESRARKRLQNMPMLIKIGITGSYGKTSAKNILAAMLQEKYGDGVLATPGSYNTPLGIARVVNDSLGVQHRIFIAEMGARYRGDVAKLCKLVVPNIGMLTAVGNQHLATFGTQEAIAATKYELVEGLAPSGLAVFSSDNDITREMYGKTNGEKRLAGAPTESATVTYDNVTFDSRGTSFTLHYNGQSVPITTKLLGRHIPSLVALCAAVALELEVTPEQIAAAAQKLPAVEHRLQLIQNGDTTILDDAYNSNPMGAANALEVLCAFEGTHIVITPGMVELGDEQASANCEWGRQVGANATYAYFIGSNAEAMQKGALEGGMPQENITVCATLDEAVEKASAIEGKKVILFENDLPDNL